MYATQEEILHLDSLYAGRVAFHGELHDHADTGGTSDGGKPLSHWRGALDALKMDFAAIVPISAKKRVRRTKEPATSKNSPVGNPGRNSVIVKKDAIT